MPETEGLVFDIQGYSVHDGPGCRSLIFMSGCPLRCRWCANPESWEKKYALLFRETKCIRAKRSCVRCQKACPREAISYDGSKVLIERRHCRTCESFECVAACLNEALVLSGKVMSVDDLMRVIDRDRQYWRGDGGVTFTGGEPFFQKEFLKETLKRCREAYIHTAMETTSFVDTKVFLDTIQYVDWLFVDLKHMDNAKHLEKTGVKNELILQNIKTIAESDWPGTIMVRTPIIEGFNDDDENIRATAEFLAALDLTEINILPFHRLGDSKWKQLGMEYPYRYSEATSPEKMDHIAQIFRQYKVNCYLGSITPF
ncbi:MAG: 4-hydroxyphenylacetate decarboxylase activase [Acidaminococcales bacterium]|jgi:pyruvate formate lyase activating enzyme|nr:4-hydroxyphenylacetate decarboxylase activase [Acidaminococcales bacterium]